MPVVKLILEYDGTRYVGWQVQPNGPSIQAEVERALAELHKGPRRVTAAGRTDAGVHARAQVCSFPEEAPLPPPLPDGYLEEVDRLLPPPKGPPESPSPPGPSRRDAAPPSAPPAEPSPRSRH